MKWIDRLRRSVKVKGFRAVDTRLAVRWPTCAVGERAEALGYERETLQENDLPVKIRQLGKAFDLAIETDDIPLAFSLYTQIQEWG